ncbi:MAG: hypothetical protein ACJAZZ_000311 [Dokdonia donghaensis]|jgi:hypothetical protein
MTTKEVIFEYLKPDTTWQALGIESQEEFISHFFIKGKFHKNVPEIIQKDYKIAEHLLFLSYYNYALIDEAFGKLTRIFEASINIKLADLGIEKVGFESLNSKIKRLEKYSSNELHKQWLHSKDLRNIFAHHKAGRLLGITLFKAFPHINNMINSVFLYKNEIINKEKSLKKILAASEHLKKGHFIMDYDNKSYLIWSMIPYTSTIYDGVEKSFWVFHPVFADKEIIEVTDFPNPFILSLKNLKINKYGLSASIIETNETIKVAVTEINNNIDKFKIHNKKINNLSLDLRRKYWYILEDKINEEITKFIYNHTWE